MQSNKLGSHTFRTTVISVPIIFGLKNTQSKILKIVYIYSYFPGFLTIKTVTEYISNDILLHGR